jgi:hypothetical protein
MAYGLWYCLRKAGCLVGRRELLVLTLGALTVAACALAQMGIPIETNYFVPQGSHFVHAASYECYLSGSLGIGTDNDSIDYLRIRRC